MAFLTGAGWSWRGARNQRSRQLRRAASSHPPCNIPAWSRGRVLDRRTSPPRGGNARAEAATSGAPAIFTGDPDRARGVGRERDCARRRRVETFRCTLDDGLWPRPIRQAGRRARAARPRGRQSLRSHVERYGRRWRCRRAPCAFDQDGTFDRAGGVGLVATWRFTPPPRALIAAAETPVHAHIHSDKAMADVEIEPAHDNSRRITVTVLDGQFGPLPAKEVTLFLANPAAGIEPLRRRQPTLRAPPGAWRMSRFRRLAPGRCGSKFINDFEKVTIEDQIELPR